MAKKKEPAAEEIILFEEPHNTGPITTTISIVLPEVQVQDADLDLLDDDLEVDMSAENLYPPIPAANHMVNRAGNQLVTPPKKEYVNRFLPLLAAFVATITFGIGLVAIGVLIGQS